VTCILYQFEMLFLFHRFVIFLRWVLCTFLMFLWGGSESGFISIMPVITLPVYMRFVNATELCTKPRLYVGGTSNVNKKRIKVHTFNNLMPRFVCTPCIIPHSTVCEPIQKFTT